MDLKKFVNEAKTERSSGNKHEFDGVGSKTLYFACSQKPKKRERSIQLVKILLKFGAGTCMVIHYLHVNNKSDFIIQILLNVMKMVRMVCIMQQGVLMSLYLEEYLLVIRCGMIIITRSIILQWVLRSFED